MDVGARKTEDALKKELAGVKNQVTFLKERTAEVRQGDCLVHCCGVVQFAAIGWRAQS
jgi:hypothetical protein